jgi:succinate dehydrogenase / fumarate reductase iron-sulfur subunit
MVETMDREGFGHCTNATECSEACPKEIPIEFIARMNRDFIKAKVQGKPQAAKGGGVG